MKLRMVNNGKSKKDLQFAGLFFYFNFWYALKQNKKGIFALFSIVDFFYVEIAYPNELQIQYRHLFIYCTIFVLNFSIICPKIYHKWKNYRRWKRWRSYRRQCIHKFRPNRNIKQRIWVLYDHFAYMKCNCRFFLYRPYT